MKTFFAIVVVTFIAVLVITGIMPAAQSDDLCLPKYKVIGQQFEEYNELSAVSNAIMDRIASYAVKGNATIVDPTLIRVDDAKQWRAAMDKFVVIGQHYLQNLMEYRALGCSPNQKSEMQQSIAKVTKDLRISRSNINSLESGLPPSAFR